MELTLHNVQQMLRINKSRLDDEMELQGEIAAAISAQVAKCTAKYDEAENELKATEHRLRLEYRETGEKMTVDEVNARVFLHRDRTSAFRTLQVRKLDLDEWRAKQEGWKQRSYMLTGLGELHATDYYAQRSMSVSNTAYDNIDRSARAALRDASATKPAARTRVQL